MAGLLDSLKPQLEAPTPNIVPIDPGTNSLIQGGIDRSLQSTGDFARQSNMGVQNAGSGALQSDRQLKQENAQLGGGSNTINTAIRNQYKTQSGGEVQRLLDANSQGAEFRKAQALQQASAQAMARQNVSVQAYGLLMQSYNATEAARAQMLSSILGAGGTAAGMAAGSKRSKKVAAPAQPNSFDEGEQVV